MRLQAETRELTVTLTPEELEDRGADLAAAVRNADMEEKHLEGRKAAWREELKGLKEEVLTARADASKLAEIVRTARDKRDVPCNWLYALTAGYAFLVRDDTGEMVTHRKLKDEERQLELGEAPFREPTPEQLEEWLKTLPVNEEEALPEGHAEEVSPDDKAADLGQYDADDFSEGDICGVTMDHDVNPTTNECRRCGAEVIDDEDFDGDPDEVDEDGQDGDGNTLGGEDDWDESGSNAFPEGEGIDIEVAVPPLSPNPGISELATMPDEQVAKLARRK
jgi:hypothetical protein